MSCCCPFFACARVATRYNAERPRDDAAAAAATSSAEATAEAAPESSASCTGNCAACLAASEPSTALPEREPCSKAVGSSWHARERAASDETPGRLESASYASDLGCQTGTAEMLALLHGEPREPVPTRTAGSESDRPADDERWAKWRERKNSRKEKRRSGAKWSSEITIDSQAKLRSDVPRRVDLQSRYPRIDSTGSLPSSISSPGSRPSPRRSVGRTPPVSPTIEDGVAEFFSHRPSGNMGGGFQDLSLDCRRSEWT
mmetsp:Transcript_69263/g.130597  ORF Transcript_69263/g.130597 Transcript_69263/m.130597 type:complete len:259 (+) Transcript_69263:166-942(+)